MINENKSSSENIDSKSDEILNEILKFNNVEANLIIQNIYQRYIEIRKSEIEDISKELELKNRLLSDITEFTKKPF